MRRQVDQRAAARPRRVGAPVVLRPVRPDPAAVDDAHGGHGAQAPVGDQLAQPHVRGVVALVERGRVRDACERRAHPLRVVERVRHRLLAQDRLAGLRRGDHRLGVPVVRGGDVHRLDLRVREQRVEVVPRLQSRRAPRPGQPLRWPAPTASPRAPAARSRVRPSRSPRARSPAAPAARPSSREGPAAGAGAPDHPPRSGARSAPRTRPGTSRSATPPARPPVEGDSGPQCSEHVRLWGLSPESQEF